MAESLVSSRIKTWKSKERNMKPAGELAQLLYSGNSSQAKNQINMLLIVSQAVVIINIISFAKKHAKPDLRKHSIYYIYCSGNTIGI